METIAASLQDLSASVTAGFVEQREYTEFAFQHLEGRLDAVEGRLGAKIDGVDNRLERVERKLDQFIDVQLLANQQTDLRLRTLER